MRFALQCSSRWPSAPLTAAVFRPASVCTLASPEVVDTFDFSALAPVHPASVLPRTPRCLQRSGHQPLPLRHWLCNRRTQMPAHLFGTPCRTAHRNENWAIPSLCRATPSATSEHLLGLLGSSPIPRSFAASCVSFQLRPLPSPGITRLPRYYGPLRHPSRPGLTLTSCRLIGLRSPLGFPVLRLVPYVYMPSPLPRQDRWSYSLILPIGGGLPSIPGGSAPALPVSGPAQRSFSLRPANSPSRLKATLYTRGFSSFVTSTTAPIATGWSEPVPGRVFPRC